MNDLLLVVLNTFIVYVFLIAAVKLFGKNEFSQLSVSDLIFILLLSEAVQNGLVDAKWESLIIAIVSATTLFCLNYLMRMLLYKSKKARKMLEGDPVLLVYEGKTRKANLDKQKITLDELKEAVRENGIEKIEDVKLAILETDGSISIIPLDEGDKTSKKKNKTVA